MSTRIITVAVAFLATVPACGGTPEPCVEMARQLEPLGDYYGITCDHPDHRVVRDGDVLVCRCQPPPAERTPQTAR